MGRVRAHDHGPVTGVGASDGRGSGDRSLAHTALAREQDDPHDLSVPAANVDPD
jgi:hypothetical protein